MVKNEKYGQGQNVKHDYPKMIHGFLTVEFWWLLYNYILKKTSLKISEINRIIIILSK